jgi:hypothetical protein
VAGGFRDAEDHRVPAGARVPVAGCLIVATLAPRQQQTYELRFVEGLTGREIAKRLGISEKTASNQITRVQELVATGFGALILYREGRPYCQDLARIIDRAEDTPGGDSSFTTAMRERIVNHFADHNLGDDCRTCNARRRELTGPPGPRPARRGARRNRPAASAGLRQTHPSRRMAEIGGRGFELLQR